jgi:hypothetical protein
LKEITVNHVVKLHWVSMEKNEHGGYELHIKPLTYDSTPLDLIIKNHNASWKEANGVLIIQ